MKFVERCRGTRIPRAGAAGQHPEEGRPFVAGLTGWDRPGHRRMAGDAERGTGDVRGAELEAAGIHIRRGVAAGAVAVQAADRHVIAGRGDYGDVDEGPDRGAVTGQTPGHALVGAGDGVERVITRGRVALRARGAGRNVVRRP